MVVFRDPDIVLRAMPRAIITCRPLRGIVTNPPYGVVAGPNEEWEKDACGKSVLRDKS